MCSPQKFEPRPRSCRGQPQCYCYPTVCTVPYVSRRRSSGLPWASRIMPVISAPDQPRPGHLTGIYKSRKAQHQIGVTQPDSADCKATLTTRLKLAMRSSPQETGLPRLSRARHLMSIHRGAFSRVTSTGKLPCLCLQSQSNARATVHARSKSRPLRLFPFEDGALYALQCVLHTAICTSTTAFLMRYS
ncbi:hypothetical protein N657DRAFT_53640 [Parathielavia appendiculata]|uniref:Uncharacterized protein n=1 Tax=Parathielavia appendiculata TaxID=2587402 RepID=A0AAN6Z8Q4_9PEZI|nr:hypothetical protein N657DRAFT_53640 [Parathielavia appendiculata]